MTDDTGWIYIPNWDDLQHYSDRRPSWIKLYLDLLDNDDFLDLTFSQRGVLIQIWILAARVGDGRLVASTKSLRRSLQPTSKAEAAHLPKTLERLIQAGFIEVRSSKALANRYQRASPDLREEKEKEEERARASANGAAPRSKKKLKCPEHKAELIAEGDQWRCPAPACRYRSVHRFVGVDPMTNLKAIP